MNSLDNPEFFPTPADLRLWFTKHHTTATEHWVGFYKKGSGRPSITWPESVDEALCHGWIDGIRKRRDEISYIIRFTPRRNRSIWSLVNVRRVAVLTAAGLMQPAGQQAFARREENRSGKYSYEQRPEALPEPYWEILSQNPEASDYFVSRSPSYRRAAIWWVISAKQEATRQKRLTQLVNVSAAGRLIPAFVRP